MTETQVEEMVRRILRKNATIIENIEYVENINYNLGAGAGVVGGEDYIELNITVE